MPVARILAAIALLASAGSLYGVSTADAFALQRLEVIGATHISAERVRATLGLFEGADPNVFRLQTPVLERNLRALPSVLRADVRVALPDRLVVTLTERTAMLVWQVGDRRFLVDAEGSLFARADRGAPGAEREGASRLPVVLDRRQSAQRLAVGTRIGTTDLAAVRQLGAVTPAMLRSASRRLRLFVDDRHGFVMEGQPQDWQAIFGFYTDRLRTPDIVPRQVQCLTGILARHENVLETITLSPAGDRCGTYRVRP